MKEISFLFAEKYNNKEIMDTMIGDLTIFMGNDNKSFYLQMGNSIAANYYDFMCGFYDFPLTHYW